MKNFFVALALFLPLSAAAQQPSSAEFCEYTAKGILQDLRKEERAITRTMNLLSAREKNLNQDLEDFAELYHTARRDHMALTALAIVVTPHGAVMSQIPLRFLPVILGVSAAISYEMTTQIARSLEEIKARIPDGSGAADWKAFENLDNLDFFEMLERPIREHLKVFDDEANRLWSLMLEEEHGFKAFRRGVRTTLTLGANDKELYREFYTLKMYQLEFVWKVMDGISGIQKEYRDVLKLYEERCPNLVGTGNAPAAAAPTL